MKKNITEKKVKKRMKKRKKSVLRSTLIEMFDVLMIFCVTFN